MLKIDVFKINNCQAYSKSPERFLEGSLTSIMCIDSYYLVNISFLSTKAIWVTMCLFKNSLFIFLFLSEN